MKAKLSKKENIEIKNFMTDVAVSAGKKLIKFQKKLDTLNVSSKQAQGVASEADHASEEFIIKAINKKFPDHQILAEEDAFKKYGEAKEALEHFKKEEWCWIIDPLDGTHNFLAGMDYFAVCICLAYKGVPQVGVIYRPITGEVFYAILGEGSWNANLKTNSRAQKVYAAKSGKKLRESMLVTGFATEKGVIFDKEFDQFRRIMSKSRGIRRMGSAALDLCYVATGMFSGFWERGLAPWDVAASGLICLEAGVKVTNYEGQKFHPFQETIVAARTPVYKELVSLFS
ncbi:MAG: inositol monophosphatase [Bacteriovoracaceae bacterium]|nr:inositol monophosphatase [Bacteriovoracaceae bacterium]